MTTKIRYITHVARDWVCSLSNITKSEALILFYMAHRVSKECSCFPKVSTMVAETKASKSTIHRVLRRLESKNLIKTTQRHKASGYRDSSLYTLNFDPNRVYLSKGQSVKVVEPECQSDHDQSVKTTYPKVTSEETNEEKNKKPETGILDPDQNLQEPEKNQDQDFFPDSEEKIAPVDFVKSSEYMETDVANVDDMIKLHSTPLTVEELLEKTPRKANGLFGAHTLLKVWKEANQIYKTGVFCPSYAQSGKEAGQMGQIDKKSEEADLRLAIIASVRFWDKFTKYVADEATLHHTPDKPSLSFFIRYYNHAIDFVIPAGKLATQPKKKLKMLVDVYPS